MLDSLKLRDAEDQVACAIVGAYRKDLDFLPAPIRASSYTDWDSIIGRIPESDEDLGDRILRSLSESVTLASDAVFFCPLGIGNHVDHRIVNAVGKTLIAEGANVIFYEDFPYCIRAACLNVFEFPHDCEPFALSLGRLADTKFYAIASYKSQLLDLFPEGVCTALTTQALHLGTRENAERYWSPMNGETGRLWADLSSSLARTPSPQ